MDEVTAARMVRCPACGRLVATYHALGSELWHTAPQPARDGEAEPAAILKPRPLTFKYERSGTVSVVCGALMLATLALPFDGRSGWSILAQWADGRGPAPGPGLAGFAAVAWGAAAAAILSGLFLRGRIRAVVLTIVGLAAMGFLATGLVADWQGGEGPALQTQMRIAQSIALASTIPFLVAIGVRMRVGPRRGLAATTVALSALVVLSSLAAVVASLWWFSTGQWLTGAALVAWNAPGFAGFWQKAGVLAEFMMASSGLALVLVAVAGTLGFLHAAAWRRLGACLWVCVFTGMAAVLLMTAAVLTGGVTGLAYGILVGGAAAILLSGLTQAMAGAVATPDDWHRA